MGDGRTYKDRREYLICANCHREVHSGPELPREIVVEKSGEFREACLPQVAGNGNPEPSPVVLSGSREGAETRASARTPDDLVIRGKRPTPYPQATGAGEEIVQAQKKFWEYL